MSALQHTHEHRIVALARRCREELGAVVDAPVWSLAAAEAGDTLIMLTQARAQLDGLTMAVRIAPAVIATSVLDPKGNEFDVF